MDAVDVVRADEMQQHVRRVCRRGGMAEVDVPVGRERIAALARLRSPLLRAAIRPVRFNVPEMLEKNMLRIARKRILFRIAVIDGADDDEGMHLDASRVGGIEQRAQRIERAVHRLRQRFRGVEVPGIASPAYLNEKRVGIALDRGLDDALHVNVRRERRAEGIDPIRAVYGTGVRAGRRRDEQDDDGEEPLH